MTGPPDKESPGAADTVTGAKQFFHPDNLTPTERYCKTVPIAVPALAVLERLAERWRDDPA